MYYVSIRHYSKQLQVFPSAQAPAVFIVKRKLLLMHQHWNVIFQFSRVSQGQCVNCCYCRGVLASTCCGTAFDVVEPLAVASLAESQFGGCEHGRQGVSCHWNWLWEVLVNDVKLSLRLSACTQSILYSFGWSHMSGPMSQKSKLRKIRTEECCLPLCLRKCLRNTLLDGTWLGNRWICVVVLVPFLTHMQQEYATESMSAAEVCIPFSSGFHPSSSRVKWRQEPATFRSG